VHGARRSRPGRGWRQRLSVSVGARERGRLADALRDADAAVAVFPEGPGRPAHAPILAYLADVLARDGRFAEARAVTLAALRADPLAVAVHSVLVALARREGRPGAVLAR